MRVSQVWNWIYVHGAREFAAMTNLARDFRSLLEANFTLARPQIVTAQLARTAPANGCCKTAPASSSRRSISPKKDRGTLCVSSQVGCTLTCTFCHTGTQKLVRNLTPAEILGQLLIAKDTLEDWPTTAPGRKVTNIVMMGMGEPLYNFDNVKAALAIAMDGDAHRPVQAPRHAFHRRRGADDCARRRRDRLQPGDFAACGARRDRAT